MWWTLLSFLQPEINIRTQLEKLKGKYELKNYERRTTRGKKGSKKVFTATIRSPNRRHRLYRTSVELTQNLYISRGRGGDGGGAKRHHSEAANHQR